MECSNCATMFCQGCAKTMHMSFCFQCGETRDDDKIDEKIEVNSHQSLYGSFHNEQTDKPLFIPARKFIRNILSETDVKCPLERCGSILKADKVIEHFMSNCYYSW